ncbi:hypothetical protein Bca52824_046273 [Brassica carinata]|uniref:Replication protein A 70 kDa DNA-binding subunit B/D first OB fold domain-containing protein n=1 Tax=Brassica carinata TaxID=52824 RepID=A0A8X7RCK5_BRACI|nr:hypothetical protein Bca52824_046273 [Brassica carinata]
MVVVDSNIHASVKKDLVNQFDPQLSEGSSKIFINFSVGQSCGSYRTSNHQYKISFLETTYCDFPYEVSGFDPANYRDILDGSLNSEYLVDVIGQIVEVSPIDVVSVNGKDTNKMALELRNSADERLQTVLWGSFATDVMEAIQMRREHAIICVIRFGKIKVWKGKFGFILFICNLYCQRQFYHRAFYYIQLNTLFTLTDERSISNAYNVSSVELNPPMAEVDSFLALLPKDELALAIVDPKPLSIVSAVSEKDGFLKNTPRKTLSQLSETRQIAKCIVMCTVAAIDSDMGWYYLSCKVCAKKVLHVPNDTIDDEDDENSIMFSYYCPKCKVSNPKLLPRYKLHLIVVLLLFAVPTARELYFSRSNRRGFGYATKCSVSTYNTLVFYPYFVRKKKE